MKARNFFALQYHPNTNMRCYPTQVKSCYKNDLKLFLDEHVISRPFSQHKDDYSNSFCSGIQKFYDIEVRYRNHVFGLHKFILFNRCPKFFLKFDQNSTSIDIEPHVNAQKISIPILQLIIQYIYMGEMTKELLKTSFKSANVTTESAFIKFVSDFKEALVEKFGFNELKANFESKIYLSSLKELKINLNESSERCEIMCDFFLKLTNQTFSAKTNTITNSKRKHLRFIRNSYAELYDCEIICNNGESIKCHKCILIARSEYFRNMFMGSWIESSSSQIQLPIDIDLAQIIVDYFYTDDIQMDFVHLNNSSGSSIKSRNEKELEILFNLYILSDQLLVERLKNLCEFKLSNLVNLKNVAEILDFSNEYEAEQLKEFCMEFISCNLVTLIDAKQLDHLDGSLLKSVSKFYKSYFSNVESRVITPYFEGLDPDTIEILPYECIYDQRFIDGNLIDEDKKRYINKEATDKNQSLEVDLNTSLTLDEQQKPDEHDIEILTPKNTPDLKWEKVRKKVNLTFLF